MSFGGQRLRRAPLRAFAPRGRRLFAGAAVVVAVTAVPVALAAEPVKDVQAEGTTLQVTTSPIYPTSTITFTGTGFATNGRGDVLNVKLDDRALIVAGTKNDVWGTYTANADGSVTGTIDLSRADPGTPVLPGVHWIRVLTGSFQQGDKIRSVHANFTVVAPATNNPGDPTTPVDPDNPGNPGTGGSGGSNPSTPGATTPIKTETGPAVIRTANVSLIETIVKPTKTKTKIALKLQANGLGSAGKLTIKSKDKFKVGKGKSARQTISKAEAYFVDKASTDTFNAKLTAAGKTLLKKKKELKAIVEIADANGEDRVKQEIWIRR